MTKSKTIFSQITTGERKSSEYGTPLDFFEKLNEVFDFDLDPCTTLDNPLRIPVIYTKQDDGLCQPWTFDTFINPPFGTKKGENIRQWIAKMQQEANKSNHWNYVMLLPLRLESNWFQEMILTDDKALIYVIKGRLKFWNPELNKNNDPHPLGSCLYIRAHTMMAHDFKKLKALIPGEFITKEEI